MTNEEINTFIDRCRDAQILIPTEIIALYTDLYKDLPEEMHSFIEVEVNNPKGGRINVVDKDKYRQFINPFKQI